MRDVTTWGVDLAGQLVTSGAQLVTVYTEVLKMVDVVNGTSALSGTELPGVEDPTVMDRLPFGTLWPTAVVGLAGALLACDSGWGVELTCFTVAEGVPQSKPML